MKQNNPIGINEKQVDNHGEEQEEYVKSFKRYSNLLLQVEWERSAQEGGTCSLDISGTRRRPKKLLTLR